MALLAAMFIVVWTVLVFFTGLALYELALIHLRRRERQTDMHEKAARFAAQPEQPAMEFGPRPDQFKLTPPKIETSFGDNERIGRVCGPSD